MTTRRLQRHLYNWTILHSLDNLVPILTSPCYWSLNGLFSCFIPTTKELKTPITRVPNLVLFPIFYVPFVLITLPFAIIGFLLSQCLSLFRISYRTHINPNFSASYRKRQYSFSTANLCLLPEAGCRYNNLADNFTRARQIGQLLNNQQTTAPPMSPVKNYETNNNYTNGYSITEKIPKLGTSTKFPFLDIICFQEMVDRHCTESFIQEIRDVFPYIVYDVRRPSLYANCYSSGLMLASRHEITHVDYQAYTRCNGHMRVVNKGVLMCKVRFTNLSGDTYLKSC